MEDLKNVKARFNPLTDDPSSISEEDWQNYLTNTGSRQAAEIIASIDKGYFPPAVSVSKAQRDTFPVIKLNGQNEKISGVNMLLLKTFQKAERFPTAEFVTDGTLKAAGATAKGMPYCIPFETQDPETGAKSRHVAKYYNLQQVVDRGPLAAFLQAKAKENQDYANKQYGNKAKKVNGLKDYDELSKRNFDKKYFLDLKNHPENAQPDRFLAIYYAAEQGNGVLMASDDNIKTAVANFRGVLAEEWKTREGKVITYPDGSPKPNPSILSRICLKAVQQVPEIQKAAAEKLRKSEEVSR